MEMAVFILIVVGCVLCYVLSTSYNQRIKEKYCTECVNWCQSAIIAVLLTATLLTIDENTFWIFLLLTIGSAGISAWLTYRKMLICGATPKEAGLGSIAQVAFAISIAAAIVFVIVLFFCSSEKKRRKKRRRR